MKDAETVEPVACVGKKRNSCRVLVGKPESRETTWETGAFGRIILKWILRKCKSKAWAGLVWLRTGRSDGML